MDRLLGRLRRFRRLFILLAVIGPGLITTNAGNDAGAIATYSQAGAEFGFRMLWILVIITISLAVVNEMGPRMAVVTGKGLADLIRERFGVRSTTFAMLLLMVANAVTTMAEFAGVAAALELFGVPRYVSVPAIAVAIWLVIVRGSYPVVERILLSIGLVYLAYIVSGVVSPCRLSGGVVPLSTAYTITEAFGWERGVGQRFGEAPAFFGIFTGLIVVAALAVLIPGVPLVSMILLSQEINGLILAVILVYMMVLVNDRRIMGRYVNGPVINAVGYATVGLLVVLIALFLLSAVPGSPLSG